MNYQEFKNKWLGKGIDYDGAYGFQCFDVINQYILELTGQRPYIRLNWADEIFKRPNDIIPDNVNYTKIANNETPDNFPQQGDIIVWDKAKWNGNGGHTAIVDNADSNRGLVLQQDGFKNWQGCQMVEWNFWSYTPLGWLRLNTNQPQPPQEPFKYIYPDVGSGLWALCKKAGYPVINTDQPNHESTNSICYNRIEELNGTRSVILGKAYKVDSRPLEWFNSTKSVDSIKLVQPQPEAQVPAQPTMPTITLPEPQVEEKLNLETELKLVEALKQVDELRSQIVARQKADILEKDLDLGEYKKESFSFLKAFKGAEKVGGITATILLFLGYLLANLSSLTGVLPPSLVAQITTGIVVLTMILKSIYSTFKK
jgi:hypothetical protein